MQIHVRVPGHSLGYFSLLPCPLAPDNRKRITKDSNPSRMKAQVILLSKELNLAEVGIGQGGAQKDEGRRQLWLPP